jgi:hypothetical protein
MGRFERGNKGRRETGDRRQEGPREGGTGVARNRLFNLQTLARSGPHACTIEDWRQDPKTRAEDEVANQLGDDPHDSVFYWGKLK